MSSVNYLYLSNVLVMEVGYMMLFSCDFQIAVVIEDKEVVNSKMDGRHWEAGKFSLSLRLSLWAEHLGLHRGEVWTMFLLSLCVLGNFLNTKS